MDKAMFTTAARTENPSPSQSLMEASVDRFVLNPYYNQTSYFASHSGSHSTFKVSAPKQVTPDYETSSAPNAGQLDYTYDFPATFSLREHRDSWDSRTCNAQDGLALSPMELERHMNGQNGPWLTAGWMMVPLPAQAHSTHFLNPPQSYFPMDPFYELEKPQSGGRPSMSVHHAEKFGMRLRENSNMTDGKEIQEETQSAPGDGRDFGEILNRAMNRASGRLIALLQEELKRLSSEKELIDEIDETDEALSNLNLDSRKSRCRL